MRLFTSALAAGLLAASLAGAGGLIRLKSGTIDTAARRPAALGHHYILQFDASPGPEVRAELARRGARVLAYVPDSALMVSSAAPIELAGLGVTWAGSLAAADKLSPELARGRYAAYLVIVHPDVSAAEARDVVRGLGFWLLENGNLLPGQWLVSGSDRKLAELAARDEVAYVLPASADLVAGLPLMACAGAITDGGLVAEYVLASPGWAKDAGGGVALNYAFQSLTPKIEENAERGEVARALAEWARYANVSVSLTLDPAAARTIGILFARGAHGDAYPFDGPGGVLAHTFFPAPPNSEPIAGDMHLDADEDWRIGAGIDLFSVALHEAGHALGLGHSSLPGSVMYPYYRQLTGLSDDDIAGIRALYGSRDSAPPVTPPTDPVPSPPVTPPADPSPSPPSGTDRTAPTLRIVSPGISIVATSAKSITLAGTAADDVGVTVVQWSVSTGSTGIATGTTRWTASVPLLVGTNTIVIRAFDAAGNSGWRAVTVVRR